MEKTNKVLEDIIHNQSDNYTFLQLWRIRDHHEALKRFYFPLSIGDTLKDWFESGYATTFCEKWQQCPEFYDNIVQFLRDEQDDWMLSEFARSLMGNYMSKESFFQEYEDQPYNYK